MGDETAYLFWQDQKTAVRRTKVGHRPVTIGSGRMCVIALPDEGAGTVHAVVERDQDRHIVRKLSRTHELIVNAETVDELPLTHGDRLRIGTSEVIYLERRELAPRTLRLAFRREDVSDSVEVETSIAAAFTVIGRAEGNLLIESRSVSRRHLEIENFGDGLRWVRDLDSTNGSELNGSPLVWRRPLHPGDQLKAGRIIILVGEGTNPPDVDQAPQQTVRFPGSSAA